MIYTVTFNPCLDYSVTVENFTMNDINRTSTEKMVAGGKGINVSIVLSNLGVQNTALGFIAGFTGEEIKHRVEKIGCLSDFIEIDNGMSRINIIMKTEKETQVNGCGPVIPQEKVDELMKKLEQLSEGDVLILAGSIPKSMSDSIYKRIMERLEGKNILIVVDATKDLLVNVLENRPFLIKPNNFELGEIFGVSLRTRDDVIPYAKKMQEKGARNVLVSMGGEGAVLLAEDGSVFKSEAPQGTVIKTVGAGDSMVAGFVAGWLEKKDYRHAFKMGISAGSASAFSTELAEKSKVEEIYTTINL